MTPAPGTAAPRRILQEQAYKQRITQWWQTRAPSYDSRASFHPWLATELVRQASLEPGHHVLDVASGTGGCSAAALQQVALQVPLLTA